MTTRSDPLKSRAVQNVPLREAARTDEVSCASESCPLHTEEYHQKGRACGDSSATDDALCHRRTETQSLKRRPRLWRDSLIEPQRDAGKDDRANPSKNPRRS